ncbi:MAG: hypothetical protein Q8R48_08505 [Candidatus Omnitrophota bacterium]|nr:hypothetical protein [Candidatus Omnitrophota bacterium]
MSKNWLVSKIFMLVFFITFLPMTCYAGKSDLPAAPEGYSWKSCAGMQASFLLPDRWFFKEEEKDGTQAVFITKESLKKVKIYKTGTVYLCVFESPEAEWKNTWPIGTTIVDNLALETEF